MCLSHDTAYIIIRSIMKTKNFWSILGILLCATMLISADVIPWVYGEGDHSPRKIVAENQGMRSSHEHEENSEHGHHDSNKKTLEFLNKLLDTLQKQEQKIMNSNLSDTQKNQLISSLDAIIAQIEADIASLSGSGGTVDTSPPVLTSPMITDIMMTSANLVVSSNEMATGYFVILWSGASAPTSAQVKLGQDSTSSAATHSGTWALISGANTLPLTGLSPDTPYVLYFVAEDTSGNLSTSPVNLPFMTLPSGWGGDTTPPTISLLTATGMTTSSASISFSSNETGNYYYVVVASWSTAPNAGQVMLGQDSTGWAALFSGSWSMGVGSSWFMVSGLSADTWYDLYLVAKDTTWNTSASPMSVGFMTLAVADTTPPTISVFSVSNITTTTADLAATLDKSGTGYYVVLPSQIPLSQIAMHSVAGNCWSAINGNVYDLTSFIPSHPGWSAIIAICGIDGTTIFNSIHWSSSVLALVASLQIGTLGTPVAAPTAAQIQAGLDSTSSLVPIRGSSATTAGINTFPVTGMSSKQYYATFFTAANTNGNLQPSPSMVNFVTN